MGGQLPEASLSKELQERYPDLARNQTFQALRCLECLIDFARWTTDFGKPSRSRQLREFLLIFREPYDKKVYEPEHERHAS
jgi:hypothetical protein